MIAYEVQDLVKLYPGQKQPANDHISLQILPGEVFGLLGDNGAGKTTLVRQMVNLLRSTSGSIQLYGEPVGRDPLRTPALVGYMPQASLALNNLTVGEALYYTAHLRGLNRREAEAERDRLLELWQIGDLRDQLSNRLSGGEGRLLRLAASIAGSPPVLVLDEPTNDLDPQRRRLVWNVLCQTNQEQGSTIIFITHDAIEAEKVVQRVAIMRRGKLAAVGRPSDLKRLVDRKLRLELFFPPDAPPPLPPGLAPRQLQPGRWLVLLEREEALRILADLSLDGLEDWRLYSATLEDLYLHYATQDA